MFWNRLLYITLFLQSFLYAFSIELKPVINFRYRRILLNQLKYALPLMIILLLIFQELPIVVFMFPDTFTSKNMVKRMGREQILCNFYTFSILYIGIMLVFMFKAGLTPEIIPLSFLLPALLQTDFLNNTLLVLVLIGSSLVASSYPLSGIITGFFSGIGLSLTIKQVKKIRLLINYAKFQSFMNLLLWVFAIKNMLMSSNSIGTIFYAGILFLSRTVLANLLPCIRRTCKIPMGIEGTLFLLLLIDSVYQVSGGIWLAMFLSKIAEVVYRC